MSDVDDLLAPDGCCKLASGRFDMTTARKRVEAQGALAVVVHKSLRLFA